MKRLAFVLMVPLMILAGCSQEPKSISILGDSYSTFEGHITPETNISWYFTTPQGDNDVTSVDQTWWHLLSSQTGCPIEMNNSFSGSTISNTGYDGADYTDRSFTTRMSNLGNPDIILVFGATNDSWAGSPIGEYKYEEWTTEDLYSFRPAMAYLLKGLKENYPKAEVHFILNSELKEEINESVRQICGHYGVNCIQLTDVEKLWGHPSIAGMASICEQVKQQIIK